MSLCKWCKITLYWGEREGRATPFEDAQFTRIHVCPKRPADAHSGPARVDAPGVPGRALTQAEVDKVLKLINAPAPQISPLTPEETLAIRRLLSVLKEWAKTA